MKLTFYQLTVETILVLYDENTSDNFIIDALNNRGYKKSNYLLLGSTNGDYFFNLYSLIHDNTNGNIFKMILTYSDTCRLMAKKLKDFVLEEKMFLFALRKSELKAFLTLSK